MTPFDICECQHYLTDKHVLGKQFPLSKKVALKNSMPGGSDNLTPLNIGEWQHWSLGLAAATTLWPPSKGFVARCRGVYCIFLVKRAIYMCAYTRPQKVLQHAVKNFQHTHDKYFKIQLRNISREYWTTFSVQKWSLHGAKNVEHTHRHRQEISEIILKKFKRV